MWSISQRDFDFTFIHIQNSVACSFLDIKASSHFLKSKARKTYLLGNWYHTVRISAHMKNDDSHQKSYYNNSATK